MNAFTPPYNHCPPHPTQVLHSSSIGGRASPAILDLIVVSAVLEDSITIAHIERFKTTGEKKKKKTPVVSLGILPSAYLSFSKSGGKGMSKIPLEFWILITEKLALPPHPLAYCLPKGSTHCSCTAVLDTIVNAFPPVNDFQELIRDGDFICSTQELVIFTPKSLAEARSYTFRLSVLLDAYVRGQNLGVFQVAGTRAPAEWFSSAVGGWNHLAR
ncbi:hypothetical protein FRB97_000601 [Tulasnella sp. 331]|nr:hypothetical protein FRB97_000601 [Tulasnella sp. 331]